MTIQEWLKDAANELADNLFPSARLDAELILGHTIRKPRTYLHAHADEEVSPRNVDIANARLELRKDYVPVAYIIGHKEFYGRRFTVNPSVLIPRPESEALITYLKKIMPNSVALADITKRRLVDIGTGSGCLGITAKLEFPELEVALTDTSRYALKVAEKNAKSHGAEIECFASDLLVSYPYFPDIVIANLPYVSEEWDTNSAELRHEPREALFANDEGLALIKKLIDQCEHRVKPSAHVLLEADSRQINDIASYAAKHGFREIERGPFSLWLQR